MGRSCRYSLGRFTAAIACALWSNIVWVDRVAAQVPPPQASLDTGESDEPLGDSDLMVPDDEIIVISGEAPRTEVTETDIDKEQGERIAGTQGDAVKAVQTLAGVSRSVVGTSGLIVWGASPANTRLLVDGVPVPRLFHLGGTRSILPSSMVSSVRLVPGGFGAVHGRAIGGLVEVDTVRAAADSRAVTISLDPFDAAASGRLAMGENTSAAIAGRVGLLDAVFDSIDGIIDAGDARQLVPIPRYYDAQASVQHRLATGDRLEWLAFAAHDRVTRGIPSVTPDTAFSEDTASSFVRVSVRLLKPTVEQVTPTLALWFGADDARANMSFGEVRALNDTRSYQLGARISEERLIGERIVIRSGLDAEYRRTSIERDGALSLPAREGDIAVFGQPPGDRVNRDIWNVRIGSVAGYVSSAIRLGDRWTLESGVRVEPIVIDGDRVLPVRPTEPAVGYSEFRLGIDPRVQVRWNPNRTLTAYAAFGRYRQAPSPDDLSPVFGSPVLEPSEAVHALAGAIVSPARWLDIELVGFGVSQRKLAVRSELATPPLAALLVSDGQGRNVGVQATIRLRPHKRVFAWLTYALTRAERRERDSAPWRLFDADQTHVAQALGSWQHPSGIELGARLGVATGMPRTPVRGSVYNAGAGRFDPIFGAHNSVRIPTFVELSARLAWRRRARWGAFKLWLDVQNATNRQNAEEIFYNADYSRQGAITGLPILPFIGAQVQL